MPSSDNVPAVKLYVLGGVGDARNPAVRSFPILEWEENESEWSHVMRVARAIRKAIAAGGTHLLVPREHADWLADNPLLAEYFVARHELVEAGAETGVLFALREPPE